VPFFEGGAGDASRDKCLVVVRVNPNTTTTVKIIIVRPPIPKCLRRLECGGVAGFGGGTGVPLSDDDTFASVLFSGAVPKD
jgi:hypothetical protein